MTTQLSIDTVIQKAMKKTGVERESDLCRYLPSNKGGYLHHFSFNKLKKKDPQLLKIMIEKHILDLSTPNTLPPNARSARGSKKASQDVRLSPLDIQKLCALASHSGEHEIAAKLISKSHSAAQLRKEILRTVRAGSPLSNEHVQAYNLTTSQLKREKESS